MTSKAQNAAPSSPKKESRHTRTIVTVLCLVAMGWGIWQFTSLAARYDGDAPAWIHIPHDATKEQVRDSLVSSLGDKYAQRVYDYWCQDPAKSHGAYKIEPGDKAINVARRLDSGRQTPVKVTYNNVRTPAQLAERLTPQMDWKEGEFLVRLNDKAKEMGLTPQQLFGRLLPDTYEMYWSSDPTSLFGKALDNYNAFWTAERHARADSLGLTPDQVATLASIVEEESNLRDEQPVIARLYLNRLARGMRLQSDPTVRFALGDFTIRRIGGEMLAIDSPYNTYLHEGLPPAPIRLPSKAAIDAVLAAPANDYLYMCASPDFNGRHLFTSSYAEHQRNAAAYRRALDRRGITL